jgi:hypothetical protein
VVAALLIPALPTLLYWREAGSLIYYRGWINIEYLLLLGIAYLFPSWGTIALLTAEMCVAMVEPIAHLYYFSQNNALHYVLYLQYIPIYRLIGYACLLLVYAIGTAMVLRISLGNHRRQWAKQMVCVLLGLCLLAATVDLLLGRFNRYHVGPQLGDVDVRRTIILRAPVSTILYGVFLGVSHARSTSSQPLNSALSQAMAEIPVSSKPDVVLVLTESWGLANDDRVNQAQMQPYRNPAIDAIYRVQTGSVHFAGPTVTGETRELCGDSQGLASINGPDEYFARCWPARLKGAGYQTFAVHGFASGMFNRWLWYRMFGFDNRTFLPELKQNGAAMCGGAYLGICDANVAHWIGDRLLTHRDERPDFVYWVTLNSHLPVPRQLQNLSLQQCAALGIDQQQSLCTWFTLVLRVQQSVARIALSPGLRPTVFVIVGDHAPPFLRSETRNQFSQTMVPFVVLIPHSIQQQ